MYIIYIDMYISCIEEKPGNSLQHVLYIFFTTDRYFVWYEYRWLVDRHLRGIGQKNTFHRAARPAPIALSVKKSKISVLTKQIFFLHRHLKKNLLCKYYPFQYTCY